MTPVTLPPSATTSAPAVTAAGHSTVLATVPDAPAAAARLDAGSVVKGTVIGRDAQGFVNIRTDKGMLALQTNANLPVGSTVTLEVRVAGARLQLVVLSVELPPGQAPLPGGAASAPFPAAAGQGGAATGAPPPAMLPASSTAPQAPLAPQIPPTVALALALTGGGLVMATVIHANHAGADPPLPGQTTTGQTPPGQTPMGQPASAQSLPGQPSPGASLPGASLPGASLPGASLPGALPAAAAPAGQAMPGPLAAAGKLPATVPSGPPTSVPLPPGGQPALASLPATPVAAGQLPGGQTPGGQTPGGQMPGGQIPGGPAADAIVAMTVARIGLPPSAAAAPATAPPPLAPGTEVGVRILGAALPGDPAPMPGAASAGTALQTAGTVIAHTPNGLPVVATTLGPMVVAVKGALPTGSTLLIEIPPQPLLADPALGPAVTSTQQALLRLFRGWPALGSALAEFGAANDVASAQALSARLPQTGPGLTSGLLSLIAHFAAGDTAEFLSPALRAALERIGKRDLADRLNGEFRQISRLAGEPSGGDWRVMFLPLRHEGELHQVNLYLRGRRKNGERDGPDVGTRFVVEVDMTRLGPIQLDGLVHGRRFDLMLRSRMQLDPSVRRDIEAIFDEARGLGGFAGSIGFQVAASFPVQPLEQAKRKGTAAGVVV